MPLVVLAGVAGAAATALAQGGGRTADPYQLPEPTLASAHVLRLPSRATGCDAQRSATVRITPPPGAILGSVRVRVDGRELARLTGVPRAASATVRVPLSGGRVTATAETLGGQRLKTAASTRTAQRNPPRRRRPAAGAAARAEVRRRTRARPRRAWRGPPARAAAPPACARRPAR